MSEIKLTSQQEEVVNAKKGNYIVSAGAGSGKTQTMIQRVVKLIESGVEIESLLIVTFTNKAANEMKSRLISQLINNPDENMRKKAKFINGGDITTFDAYFLKQVNKFSNVLGISQKVMPCDEKILSLLSSKTLDDIFNEIYENKQSILDDNELVTFKKLIYNFAVKSDDSLKALILQYYNIIQSSGNSQELLSKHIKLYDESSRNNAFHLYVETLRGKLKEYVKIIDKLDVADYYLDSSETCESILDFKDEDMFISNLIEEIENKLFKKRTKKRDEEAVDPKLESIVKTYKTSFEKMSISNRAGFFENMEVAKSNIYILIKITKALILRVEEYKKKHNLYSFNDISQLAMKLFEDKSIIDYYKTNLEYIIVDEYQDTSDIQDNFIKIISNNNLMLIGDIKQSIYKFRNANYRNFLSKIKSADGKQFKLIELHDNFRSSGGILNFVNFIFERIMTENIGGINYREKNQQLKCGQTSRQLERSLSTFDLSSFEEATGDIDKPGEDNEDHEEEEEAELVETDDQDAVESPSNDDDIKEFDKQIKYIAYDINARILKKETIYDSKLKKERTLKFSDFAVLVNKSRRFEDIKQIFFKNQIPSVVEGEENLSKNQVVLVTINIFKYLELILNKVKDQKKETHLFASIARSFLFSLSDQELVNKVKSKSIQSTNVYEILSEIASKINYLSLKDLVTLIFDKFDYYERIIILGDSYKNNSILEFFYKNADFYDNNAFGFSEYINFLSDLNSGSIGITMEMPRDNIDAVTIMTIHKSKGLEFNVIYYPYLRNSFSSIDYIGNEFATLEYGIIIPTFFPDELTKRSVFRDIYCDLEKRETISEYVRLFYVALTRAREEIVIPLDLSKEMKKTNYNLFVLESRNFFDFLMTSELLEFKGRKIRRVEEQNLKSSNLMQIEDLSKIEYQTIEVPVRENKPRRASKETVSIDKEKAKDGIRLHLYFEQVDFVSKDTSFIEDSRLKKLLDNALKLDIFKDIKDAKVYTEFSYIDSKNSINGIIDLLAVYKDHIDIIDYKTKNIDDSSYDKQLIIYEDYIKQKFNLPINKYLLSIVDCKVRKVA